MVAALRKKGIEPGSEGLPAPAPSPPVPASGPAARGTGDQAGQGQGQGQGQADEGDGAEEGAEQEAQGGLGPPMSDQVLLERLPRMTVQEMMLEARRRNIPGRSKHRRRSQLIALLRSSAGA